ncbi:kinase-like domain-containing protein [Rhizophagus clarus]|uniref:Kinase-like domain-containing protein n=1 Tax=Rhizophagus clarus TaxID=94130 RepID=A0A8H3QDK6_9GLOM|nr:kinase-like domain-containing protein [Rhizophagus clarus]
MSYSLNQSVNAAINRALALIGYNVHNDALKHYEFMRRTILADDSLAENEKPEAIRSLTESYDAYKIIINQGSKRICENCKQECFATLYCELCVRNYLKEKFVNWTSGNVDIDNLIQECQINSFKPIKIPEWIPYNNLQNIQYLTKGGCSEIYTADRVDGAYYKWDSKEKQLIRIGRQKVILKKLENVENANQSWFEEAKSHLILSNKWPCIVQCFGLTQDLTSGSYMLVMTKMNMDLRRYLQQNHNEMTWRKRIKIVTDIIIALNINNDNLEVMSSVENYTSTTSKLYHFDNFPEPKNATEEEQEVLHSKSYNFYIPNNIVDFDKLSNQKNNTSKITNMFKDVQNEDRRILMQQHINNHYIIVIDEDEVYNNPNLHSEDQDELELPDGN